MLRGATYNRFSSDNQRTESIDAQLRFNYEYAKKNSIEIVKDYIDEAKSGKTDDREAFQQMLADAKSGLFDVVICHKVDRFARNRIDSAINKYNLQKQEVKVVFSGQNIDESPEGQLMEGILESFAEYYSLNLAKETMKGLMENAHKCRFNGGYVPFGYSIEPLTKKYIINEKEARYVKLIFDRFLDGAKFDDIIEELNLQGVVTRFGRQFSQTSLHELLKNEKYAGIYVFNQRTSRNIDGMRNNRSRKESDKVIRIPGGIPQIIETEVFLMTQEKMNLRKRTTRAKELYLLTGLVYCSECGRPYCGNRKYGGSGNLYTTYRCNGRCGNKEVDKDFIENYVYEKIESEIFNVKALNNLSKKLNDYVKNTRKIESAKLASLKNRISEIQFEQNNIINAISKGYDQPVFKQKLTEYDEELKNIKYEMHILNIKLESQSITPRQIDESLKEQRQFIEERNFHEIKKFISNYVETVIVSGDGISVKLNFDNIPI